MNKNDYITLFNSVNPDLFEREDIKKLPDNAFFEEMLLPLDEFDVHKYKKSFDDNISFGFYDGSFDELKEAIAAVDKDWLKIFHEDTRVFCGFYNDNIASFCIVEDMGIHTINGRRLKIGGPGCVGTVPEYRNKGIGLTMVKCVTLFLKREGYDYSYIHYTGVAPWYEKLGYKTIIKWNNNGIV
ncbi:MAG: GNAT family N-acetyltransferase [Oscillospiraceae bacterium]